MGSVKDADSFGQLPSRREIGILHPFETANVHYNWRISHPPRSAAAAAAAAAAAPGVTKKAGGFCGRAAAGAGGRRRRGRTPMYTYSAAHRSPLFFLLLGFDKWVAGFDTLVFFLLSP